MGGWYEDGERLFTVHYGIVGERGDYYAIVKEKLEHRPDELMMQWAEEWKEKGYVKAARSDFQEQIVEFGTMREENMDADMEKWYLIEHLLDQCLGWTGNGHCDRGEYRTGVLTVTCRVIDAQKAVDVIIDTLKSHQLLEAVTIGMTQQEDARYISFYPRACL